MTHSFSKIFNLIGVFMAVVYIFSGVFLLISDTGFLSMGQTYQKVLGFLFLIYGLYRVYKGIKLKFGNVENR